MELEAQKYAYSQTHVPFLSIPMSDITESGWSELTISDLNLSPSLSDALKYNNFYEFDEFSLIESTTVEYLWRLLGEVHFQKFIEHLDQCGIWKNKKYQIASELLVDKKWAELSIPKSLVDVGEYAMLQKEGIISWADYNQYITTPHIIDSNFIAICHFQVKYATEIIHFQKLLDRIANKSADELFLASFDFRSRMIYKSRFIDGNTLDVIAVSTGLTKERIRQITKQQDEQLKISTPIALPLTELSALYLYLECFIEDIRGVANQEFFLEQLDSAFHCDQQYLQLILHFCELNFNVTTEKNRIIFQKCSCLSCIKLRDNVKTALEEKEELSFEEQKQIVLQCCASCCRHNGKQENLESFLSKHRLIF